jgi:hypothetical protein
MEEYKEICKRCKGKGIEWVMIGPEPEKDLCPDCNGMGFFNRLLTDKELLFVRDTIVKANPGKKITANHISQAIKASMNLELDEATIRGRFIQMGQPLGGTATAVDTGNPVGEDGSPLDVKTKPESKKEDIKQEEIIIPDDLKAYIPSSSLFDTYIQRPVDTLLAIHLDLNKYPIAQGKQGTGKTFSFMHYAWNRKLPFFLYSAYEDFNLRKYFGDKTIEAGSIKFQEGLFIKAISNPSVILIDEVNAIAEANIKDFNAFLQNRQLYIKDADNSKGKTFDLHPQCKIGFAQNPRSSKYIGGKVRGSDFLGRCTYITYPEFTTKQIDEAITKKFPGLIAEDKGKFVTFYKEINRAIDSANIPFDISIRQLNNVIDLWMHRVPLREALESGMLDIAEAASQPKTKEALFKIAQAIWAELK